MKRLSKTSRANGLTYVMVVAAFVILQALSAGGGLSSTLQGQLVPICAYVVMALSLNLTVGILGELSLGHAGFMSVGAFAGTVAAVSLQAALPSAPVRLLVSMIVGAGCAAVAGCGCGATTWPSSRWRSVRSSRASSIICTSVWTAWGSTSASSKTP